MAKKKGRPPKSKLQKAFEKIAKTGLKFSEKVTRAALEAGFVQAQIEKFESEEYLKLAVIRAKPGLAVRFIKRPTKLEAKEKIFVDKECEFEVKILAGFSPLVDHMRKEAIEIDRMVKRKGISVFSIQSMSIERSMVASEDGRKHSKVLIKYRKEE